MKKVYIRLHTLVWQFQSLLNRFVKEANNYTSQRKVDNGSTLESTLLEGPYRTFTLFIKKTLDNALKNNSSILFGVKSLSFDDRTPNQKRKSHLGPALDSKKPNVDRKRCQNSLAAT